MFSVICLALLVYREPYTTEMSLTPSTAWKEIRISVFGFPPSRCPARLVQVQDGRKYSNNCLSRTSEESRWRGTAYHNSWTTAPGSGCHCWQCSRWAERGPLCKTSPACPGSRPAGEWKALRPKSLSSPYLGEGTQTYFLLVFHFTNIHYYFNGQSPIFSM